MTIYWDTMTWEAFATLCAATAAAAAVVGAVVVGNRQGKILAAQTNIAASMLELEELKLRSELYEKRIEVFSAIREILSFVVMTGKVPGMDRSDENGPLALDTFQNFQKAVSSAQFLFNEKTCSEIDDIYAFLANVSNANLAKKLGKNSTSLNVSRTALKEEAHKRFRDLADHFPELKLAKPMTSAGDRASEGPSDEQG